MSEIAPPAAPSTACVEASAVASVLGDLALVHRHVLVTTSEGEALWASDALLARCGLEAGSTVPRASVELGGPRADGAREVRASLAGRGAAPLLFEGWALPSGKAAQDRRLVCVLRGSTRGGRCETSLRGTVGYLSAIVESAPDGVLAFDRDGFVTYSNAAVERLFGRSAREALNRPLALLVANHAELARLASRLISGAEVDDHDVQLQLGGGAITSVSVSARPVRVPAETGGGDRVVGWVAFLRDVTERKRMEAELGRKNSELEHYVQTVSHDLRSPLVSLLGFSRLLRQDYADRLDETGRHFLSRIEQAGRTMETLIHDLLEFSRIGKRGEERRLVDPRPVLQQLHAELKPRLEERDIRLELPASPPLLLCDRTRLYQVFSNLIGNAIDHMGSAPEACIRVEIEEKAASHHVRVIDNGRGIPIEEHDRVFELFHTRGTRADGQRANGIGLAIVKKIAEAHGGRAWVDSTPGAGATFHLLLPRG
jgi:PAS domain S-box-containing protein